MILPREALCDLLLHQEWADARVWAAIPTTAPDDARLRQLLTHIHTVQHAFLTIWTRGDIQLLFRQSASLSSLPEVRAWARGYYARANALLAGTDDQQLGMRVEMPWAAEIADFLGHPPGPTTLAETFLQVTSHSTYHRGQVNARLRELDLTPPLVDYIAWLWACRPKPEWPESSILGAG